MAKKKKTKKKKTAKPLPKTLNVNGKQYTKKVCGKTKTDAAKVQKKHKEGGTPKRKKLAIKRKDPVTGKWCVFTRG